MNSYDENLKKTEFIVEATSYEQLMLWEKYCKDGFNPIVKYNWEQLNPGFMTTVGELTVLNSGKRKKYPINISCNWCKINGVMVMFYESVSMISHYDMIKKWVKKHCNNHVNAGNFYLVIEYIETSRKNQNDKS